MDKINGIDELQGKSYIEDSYLYLYQLIKTINILSIIKLIHKNFCLGNQHEYLMKN